MCFPEFAREFALGPKQGCRASIRGQSLSEDKPSITWNTSLIYLRIWTERRQVADGLSSSKWHTWAISPCWRLLQASMFAAQSSQCCWTWALRQQVHQSVVTWEILRSAILSPWRRRNGSTQESVVMVNDEGSRCWEGGQVYNFKRRGLN